MAGLLDGVLPYLYSRSDALKRQVNGLLSDPVGTLQQVYGDAEDRAGGLLATTRAATKEGMNYGPATQKLAGALADAYNPAGMVYPQQQALETARKNAVKMLGLPENNTAADRAKALGFADEGLLHGTTNDFPAFTKSDRSNVYATEVPAIADIYATATGRHKALREINAGPNVIPLMARGTRITVSDMRDGNGGWYPDNLAAKLGMDAPVRNMTKEAAARGFDGVKITNMSDLGGEQTQFVFHDPKVLRSRFAAFDPARVNDNDLLGRASPEFLGLLGVLGLGGAAALSDK